MIPHYIFFPLYMGVSKNTGTPKWMVKIMENPIKMDDLGVPLFSETSISSSLLWSEGITTAVAKTEKKSTSVAKFTQQTQTQNPSCSTNMGVKYFATVWRVVHGFFL